MNMSTRRAQLLEQLALLSNVIDQITLSTDAFEETHPDEQLNSAAQKLINGDGLGALKPAFRIVQLLDEAQNCYTDSPLVIPVLLCQEASGYEVQFITASDEQEQEVARIVGEVTSGSAPIDFFN